jgi:4-hydroxybutyrate CoA-transferase
MEHPPAPDFAPYLTPIREPRAGRHVDVETALAAIPEGARVLTAPISGTPLQLLEAVDAYRDRWERLELIGGFLLQPIAPLKHAGQPFHFSTWQFSSAYRAAIDADALEIIPARYSQAATMFTPSGGAPVDVVLATVSPPGPDGRLSLGVSVGGIIDAVHSAPLVIGQINRQAPYTYGAGELPQSAFDYLVDLEGPLPELHRAEPTDVELRVAANVVELVPDGATLQFGLGSVPEAIMGGLREHRDLGIHSGMVSDGIIELTESGALTNSRKTLDAGFSVTAEVVGTRRLYDWVDHNPTVRMAPGRYSHGVPVLAQAHRLVAINSAVQITLDGTVNSESVRGRLISGPGGQPDFAEAVFDARDGIGIIAIPSTAARGTVSRIVAALDDGGVATLARSLADRFVTEYGAADLRGLTMNQRADAMRRIAHPDFQQTLR